MSVLGGNPLLLGGADAAFTTQRSVRVRQGATAYFTRTPATNGNGQKFTVSCWVKRGRLGTGWTDSIIEARTGLNFPQCGIMFSSDTINIQQYTTGAAVQMLMNTVSVFRDTSAWYHVVVAFDTTLANANDRVKVWVNNVQQTLTISTAPAQNLTLNINQAVAHYIGSAPANTAWGDLYFTEYYLIDGQALTPSSFGEYNTVRNTQWQPKIYTGTYGTNGSYLKFADNSAATAAALGKDSSGNGNNWTPTNISLTAGVTYDSMTDVPTLTSDTASNFAVMNPLARSTFVASSSNPSTGNLVIYQATTASWAEIIATMGASSGKWYWEIHCSNLTSTSNLMLGVVTEAEHSNLNSSNKYVGSNTAGYGYYSFNGNKYNNGSATAYGSAYVDNDIVGVALDMDAGTLTFYKNGVSQGVAFSGITGIMFPAFSSVSGVGTVNFGQRPFSYPLAGHKSFNTFNLPNGAVDSSDDYHKVYTYTGNGGGQQVGEIQKPLSLYNLDRSLRFKGTNSYFDKVFASGGANTKGTFSFWVKRGKLAVQQELIRFGTTGTLFSGLLFNASDQLAFLRLNSTYQVNLVTTRVFRDPNAWYHIVVAWDSTLGSSSNSVKIYINGIQETVFSSATYPTASLDMYFFTAGTHNIGRYPVGGNYFDGYMAEFHAVDGTQLTADSFGQFDGNYYWTPKDYVGGYGTNGWHLDFEDFSSMSATGIGKDVSGLSNNFTPYNFNVTTPANTNANWDSMVDVPTSTSADVANFCVLDPIAPDKNISGTGGVYSDGNLKIAANGAASDAIVATGNLGCANGKFYAEVTCITAGSGGAQTTYAAVNIFGSGSAVYLAYDKSGQYYNGTAWTAGWSSWTANDTIGISIDQTVTPTSVSFYKNGTLQGTLTTISTSNLTFAVRAAYAASFAYNFGQRPFRYTPPTGFKSLNSFNVAEVTGDLESPDFVWIKSRSAGTEHALFNSVVGTGKYLRSSNTAIEVTDVNSLIQFNKNGFLLGNAAIVNASAATFVASAWKVAANNQNITVGQYGTTPANVPSIASTVRANPTAGVSVVTYTGNQTAGATVGHGLGVAPSLIIAKTRTAVTSWAVYHKSLGATSWLMLNSTLLRTVSAQEWNNTEPTSTVFTVGNSSSNSNQAATTVAYCFAEIAGFSKFTSYLANASSTGDGPFVACGFAPRWIMIKRATGASGSGGWIMYDTARSTYNTMSEYLFAEGAAGANTLAAIDVTANGFKIKTNNVHLNQTANDIYIVMAFAEHPFKYSLAR